MATMQQQQEFDALIQTVDVLQATRFCQVAAVVIVIHDYVLNFDNEIRHIWGKRFSLVTVLYLVNRYVGSIIIICDALLFTNTSFSVQTCKIFQLIACFGPFISIWSTQLIMQLRLYAMYSNSKRILSFTLTLLLLEMAGTVTVIVIWMRIITYNNRPFAPWIDSWHMCATSSPNRSLTAIYVPIFAYEMVMFGLALFAVFHKLGGIGAAVQSRTRLQATVNMLFKYSIVYFAVYFIACAVAIGMYLGLPPTYIDVLNVFLMAISVLLGSHMVLGARGFSPTPEVSANASNLCYRTVGSGKTPAAAVNQPFEMTSTTIVPPTFAPTTSFASFSCSAHALGTVHSPAVSYPYHPFRPSQFPTSSVSCASVAQSPLRHDVECERVHSPFSSSLATVDDEFSDVASPNSATQFLN